MVLLYNICQNSSITVMTLSFGPVATATSSYLLSHMKLISSRISFRKKLKTHFQSHLVATFISFLHVTVSFLCDWSTLFCTVLLTPCMACLISFHDDDDNDDDNNDDDDYDDDDDDDGWRRRRWWWWRLRRWRWRWKWVSCLYMTEKTTRDSADICIWWAAVNDRYSQRMLDLNKWQRWLCCFAGNECHRIFTIQFLFAARKWQHQPQF